MWVLKILRFTIEFSINFGCRAQQTCVLSLSNLFEPDNTFRQEVRLGATYL